MFPRKPGEGFCFSQSADRLEGLEVVEVRLGVEECGSLEEVVTR